MSVINRIPLINEILGKLTASQLGDLKDCINGEGGTPVFRSLKPISNEHLTASDKGVKPITIELATILGGMSAYEGYLIYTDEICYVICFSGDKNQGLNILKINPSTCEAEFVNGSLTILELRSELDDALDTEDGGGSSSGGTEVVANPELAGTESNLTGLQIESTKYKVDTVSATNKYSVNTGSNVSDQDKITERLTVNGAEFYAPFGYMYRVQFKAESDGSVLYECVCATQIATRKSLEYGFNISLQAVASSMGITLPTDGENTNFNTNVQYLLDTLFAGGQGALAYTFLAGLCNQTISTFSSKADGKDYTVFISGSMYDSPLIIDSSNSNQITSISSILSNASIKYVEIVF